MDFAYWHCTFCDYEPRYDLKDNPLPAYPEPEIALAPRPSNKKVIICPSCRGRVA